jgi:chromosome segregation ATPase
MNPTQVTSLINQQKKQINDLQNSMQQNRKNMEILISKKDNEIIQLNKERDQIRQERDQMKQERDQMKQELEQIKTADQKTIDYMNENNFKYQKKGPFIILS